MPTAQRDVIDVLNYALELEEQGHRFYDELSKTTKDPRGRQMYERLREDEAAHRRVLEREMAALRETGQWSDEAASVPATTLQAEAERIFDVDDAMAGGAAEARELQALERAMEAEQKSRDLYAEQAEKTSIPAAKEMWRKLSRIEQTHLDLLMWEHDHLRGEGYWLDIAQFTMDEL